MHPFCEVFTSPGYFHSAPPVPRGNCKEILEQLKERIAKKKIEMAEFLGWSDVNTTDWQIIPSDSHS